MKEEEKIGQILKAKHLTIATTESCTGGLLSSKLTDVSGSSDYVKLNFVTYCNEAKHNILGVSNQTLSKFGAVSQECSIEMAQGLHNMNRRTIGSRRQTGRSNVFDYMRFRSASQF